VGAFASKCNQPTRRPKVLMMMMMSRARRQNSVVLPSDQGVGLSDVAVFSAFLSVWPAVISMVTFYVVSC
jgi:hypothetical protein